MPDASHQILDAALEYAARGWPVHPCTPGDKRPTLKDWPTQATTDAATIRRWWAATPDANVGIVTGTRSGVWALDLDGPQGLADLDRLEAQHGALPATRVHCSPSGGGHYFFSMPAGLDLRNRAKIGGMNIDVRASGGYVVAPPSKTPKGAYTVATDLPIADAPAWLLELVTQPKHAAPATPSLRPTFDIGDSDRVRRARAYLDKIPGGVDGEHGSNPCLWAASVLVWGYCLDRGTARQLMGEYSARCSPPWSEREIEHKLDDAAKGGIGKPQGWLLDAPRPERNGTPSPSASTRAATTEPERPSFEFIDSKQFASGDYRPTWLIKGVLTRGEPGGIGGPMKSLKTSIAVDMALSVATGTPFLGYFDVPCPVTTAIISGESGRSTLQKIAERVCDAKGITLESVGDRLHWCTDIPRLDDHVGMTIFADELAKRGVGFVLLDPLFLMLGDVNAANLFEAGALLRNVGTLLVKAGVTPVFLHHARKVMEPGKPMELADLSHSGFAEFVRQFILLNRMNPYRAGETQELVCRIGGSAGHGGEYLLAIDEGTLNEDFGGRIWSVRVTNTADVPKATQEDRDAEKTAKRKAAGAAKRERFLADIDAELAAGFPAITQNKLKGPQYGWSHADVKAVSECLLMDGLIELHEFKFEAGNGAMQDAIGFRRPVVKTQENIPFGEQPVQPVEGAELPSVPAVPGEGGELPAEQPVELSPYKGEFTGLPVVPHPAHNRQSKHKGKKPGRRKPKAGAA